MGEYTNKIAIVISKWDQADNKDTANKDTANKDTAFKEICREFDLFLNSILFVSREAPGDEIANTMYAVAPNIKKSSADLEETDFLSNFNLASIKISMIKDLFEFRKQANKLLETYREAVKTRSKETTR